MAIVITPSSASGQPAPLSGYLIRSAVVAALGSLLFGFETAVISGTTGWLRSYFALSNSMLGFTVTTAMIGTIVGSVTVAKPVDIYGRRGILFAIAVLFLFAALGCALATNLWWFMLARFVGGVAVGAASVVAPLYIAELSPAAYRGRLVTITQLNIVLGILLAYLSNYIIGEMHLGNSEARWMFGVMAVPTLPFILLLFFAPQSPRWLLSRGRVGEAKVVLEQCGTDTGDVDEEIRQIQLSFDHLQRTTQEPLFQRKYRKPIMLAVAIAVFNQLSGINAVLYYTAYIFTAAGADKASALLQSVIIGFTLLVFTVAALVVIDHFGRRKLMVVGSIGYILSLTSIAWAFYTGTGGALLLVSMLVFVAAHSFGQGSVIWVFIGEVFPNQVRARGQGLATSTHWVLAAAISWTFPMIAAESGWIPFVFYGVCMVGQLLWVLLVMPETKGIPLEEIQKRLGIG